MAGVGPAAGVRTITDHGIGGGGVFRVATLQAEGRDGPVSVYVGSTVDVVDDEVVLARSLLAAGLPLLIALVGATTWIVVGRALRPVEAIRAEVADITARDLHRRVSRARHRR